MELPIIRVTPDQLGYKDRGIMKWLGMMLSDHSEALKKEKRANDFSEPKKKKRMLESEIGKLLYQAYTANLPIQMQANVLRGGNYYPDLQCKVTGYVEDKIYFLLKDDRSVYCSLEQIRNIEFMDILEWHNKKSGNY